MAYDNSRMRREIGQYVRHMEDERLNEDYVRQTRNSLLRFLAFSGQRDVRSVGKVSRELVWEYMKEFKTMSAAISGSSGR